MNIKLLTFIIICCHLANGSQVTTTPTTTQDFLQKIRTHFTTIEQTQALLLKQLTPGDEIFKSTSRNIELLATLLKEIAPLCATNQERQELAILAKKLANIAEKQCYLISLQNHQAQDQSSKLERSQSAPTISTTPQASNYQRYSSFQQPKSNNNEPS